MIKEVKIPEISENVTSGKVVAVLVKPGDGIEVDDPVIEFETEKAVVEIPSPFKGRVEEVLVAEGDELSVGDVIARIDTEADADRKGAAGEGARGGKRTAGADEAEPQESRGPAPREDNEVRQGKKTAREVPEAEEAEEAGDRKAAAADQREEAAQMKPHEAARRKTRRVDDAPTRAPAPASPSVRRFARELGVDIHAVRPAETGGRITEADVKSYVKTGGAKGAAADAGAPGGGTELPDFSRWGEVETRELGGVRRLTAEKLTASRQAVVPVTQFDRADVTSALKFVARHADAAADRGGKLTITAVLMKICAEALRRFSQFNASIDLPNHRLILKNYVHIGLAVDTPRGLLVPVVRDADRKSILELAVEIADLAGRARDKKIKPDEMEGGTFTISNQGGIGGTHFTPVVFWPQAAILGVSRATTEPVYIEGELRPRRMLPLALSYDHRIADGADAARFLRWVCESIEQPLRMHLD